MTRKRCDRRKAYETQLEEMVAESEALARGLQILREAVSAALAGGLAPAQIRARLGLETDRGVLWDLVKSGGSLRSWTTEPLTIDRRLLPENVSYAAHHFRSLLVEHALVASARLIREWLAAAMARGNALCESLIELRDEVGYQMSLRGIRDGTFVPTRCDTDSAWQEIHRLRRGVDPDRAAIARYLALAGASQRDIAMALGGGGLGYGHRPTLAVWRRLGAAAAGAQANRTAVVIAAAENASKRDAHLTKIAFDMLELRRSRTWSAVPTPGDLSLGRHTRRADCMP